MERPKKCELSVKVDMSPSPAEDDRFAEINISATVGMAKAMLMELINVLYVDGVTKEDLEEAVELATNDNYQVLKKIVNPLSFAVSRQLAEWDELEGKENTNEIS